MTEKTTAQEVREAEASTEAQLFLPRLDTLDNATQRLEKDPDLAAEGVEDGDLADTIATLQDIRYRLGLVERDLTTALGKRLGKTMGELSDGRRFELTRSADRKEWHHDEWKHDVRRAIVQRELHPDTDLGAAVIVTADGEEAEVTLAALLHQVITSAQEVHGSQAPKSRSLSALGLYASDYCTSTPGGWRFAALKPATTTEDTDG